MDSQLFFTIFLLMQAGGGSRWCCHIIWVCHPLVLQHWHTLQCCGHVGNESAARYTHSLLHSLSQIEIKPNCFCLSTRLYLNWLLPLSPCLPLCALQAHWLNSCPFNTPSLFFPEPRQAKLPLPETLSLPQFKVSLSHIRTELSSHTL